MINLSYILKLYIVKAKLSEKSIIIVDEILSNLDKEKSLKDKTIIHIAHNYNIEYLERYDMVIKLI